MSLIDFVLTLAILLGAAAITSWRRRQIISVSAE